MTTYETTTLIISIAAIVASIGIPLTGYLYRRLQKPKLDIYEFEHQPLTIIRTPTSSQIKLDFSVLCRNARCIARSIEARIVSANADKPLKMRWTSLEPINLNWANGMGSVINLNTVTRAHPLLLEADSLTPLSVHFESSNEEPPRSWRDGYYELTIKLLYDANETFEKSYHFSLSAEEAERLQLDTAKTINSVAYPMSNQTENPPFTFVVKDFDRNA